MKKFLSNNPKTSLVIAIIVSLFLISRCNSSSSNEEKTPATTSETTSETTSDSVKETETFKPGEFGYLTDKCIGVVDLGDMGKVMDFLKADDKTGLMQMGAAGKITSFASGKRVKVVKVKFEHIQVRDIDGTERLVWIPKGMLTHEDVWGIYKDE